MSTKEQWIEDVCELLCKQLDHPPTKTERANLHGYAEAMASEESAYFQEGMTPQQAFDEEASCS